VQAAHNYIALDQGWAINLARGPSWEARVQRRAIYRRFW